MHYLTWTFFLLQLANTLQQALSATITTYSVPHKVRRAPSEVAEPSNYPYGSPYENEMKYLGYDPKNDDHKAIATKLHDGFNDMLLLAKLGYNEADKKSTVFKRWFDESHADQIKAVFEKIVDPVSGSATPLMKDWVNYYEDYRPKCEKGIFAYTTSKKGKWHMCRPKGQDQPSNQGRTCSDIDGYASEKMESIAMTMLHEATHWIKVGDAALTGGWHIGDSDVGHTAWQCFTLPSGAKLLNAQNYAFLGQEAYFNSLKCPLQDPPKSTAQDADDNGDIQDDLLDDNDPTTLDPPPPPPPGSPSPAPAPANPNSAFNPGKCCFHLTETELACSPEDNNLRGYIKMVDDKKQPIGETTTVGVGERMDASSPYHFKSKLKNELVVTGEHANDYVQFTLAGKGLSWTSKQANGGASCTVGGWDPRDGSNCDADATWNAINNMDCCFPCDKDT